MLQDIEAGRRTEIASLNGAITRLGKLHAIQTPFHDTMVALITAGTSPFANKAMTAVN